MLRDHLICTFGSAPIVNCAREMVAPAPVLASTWPLAAMGLAIVALAGWAFLRAVYPRRIDWSRDQGPDWDVGSDERPTIEIRARRAGE